ncbi:MAG: rane protein [Frankiales bacterium]|jgi:energy-coupling factor transport system substrate-specific component|nr:rane protein [Frankiales bacterium]
MSTTTSTKSTTWRTVDIVVAAVLAVAFGVVFWAWNQLYAAVSPAFTGLPPLQGLMYGIWLLPGVLGAMIIRKPGAALFTELVAAIVSALLGNQWGLTVIWYGLLQGGASELVFLLRGYRRWTLPTALLAGAAAGVAAAVLDIVYYYPDWSTAWMTTYGVLVALSAAVVAGVGAWLLVRALAPTGVLAPFRSGSEQAAV